jgi:hypothetical protein
LKPYIIFGDKIKEDEINGHVAHMGEKKMHVGFCCGS